MIVKMTALVAGAVLVLASYSVRQARAAAPAQPPENEPPPLAEPLLHCRVVIQHRSENLYIAPIFAVGALGASARVEPTHVTVDGRLADATVEPLIVNVRPAALHQILIQLVNANHQPLDHGELRFIVSPRHHAEYIGEAPMRAES